MKKYKQIRRLGFRIWDRLFFRYRDDIDFEQINLYKLIRDPLFKPLEQMSEIVDKELCDEET